MAVFNPPPSHVKLILYSLFRSVWPYATIWPCKCNHRTQLSPPMRSICSPGPGKQNDFLVITRLNYPEWKRGTEEDKLQNEQFAYVHGHRYCGQKTSRSHIILRTNDVMCLKLKKKHANHKHRAAVRHQRFGERFQSSCGNSWNSTRLEVHHIRFTFAFNQIVMFLMWWVMLSGTIYNAWA